MKKNFFAFILVSCFTLSSWAFNQDTILVYINKPLPITSLKSVVKSLNYNDYTMGLEFFQAKVTAYISIEDGYNYPSEILLYWGFAIVDLSWEGQAPLSLINWLHETSLNPNYTIKSIFD